jgi:hypothetical protein
LISSRLDGNCRELQRTSERRPATGGTSKRLESELRCDTKHFQRVRSSQPQHSKQEPQRGCLAHADIRLRLLDAKAPMHTRKISIKTAHACSVSVAYLVPGVGLDLGELELRVVGVHGLDLLPRRRAQHLDDLHQLVHPTLAREQRLQTREERRSATGQSAELRRDLVENSKVQGRLAEHRNQCASMEGLCLPISSRTTGRSF